MRKDILNQIKVACDNSVKKYEPLFSKDKQKNISEIAINKDADNLLNNRELKIEESQNLDCYIQKKVIYIPDKEHFISNSNYHHVILHEAIHNISYYEKLSSDYLIAYRDFIKTYKQHPNVMELVHQADKSSDINLDIYSKRLVSAYLKDETAVELATYNMLEKVGLKPDERDKAYMLWSVSKNNETLEKLGEGFGKDYSNLGKMLDRADKLYKIVEKEYCKANDIKQEISKPKEQERER